MSPMMAKTQRDQAAGADALQARNAISSSMFCAAPHRAEPSRNATMANWNTGLRP